MNYLLDTDHTSLLLHNDPNVMLNLVVHAVDTIAISVITIEEELFGWQANLKQTRDLVKRERIYRNMARTIMDLSGWTVIPFSLVAMNRFLGLMRLRLNVGSNDLRIASIALEQGAVVVTRNRRDFSRVPGLAIADWSK